MVKKEWQFRGRIRCRMSDNACRILKHRAIDHLCSDQNDNMMPFGSFDCYEYFEENRLFFSEQAVFYTQTRLFTASFGVFYLSAQAGS